MMMSFKYKNDDSLRLSINYQRRKVLQNNIISVYINFIVMAIFEAFKKFLKSIYCLQVE